MSYIKICRIMVGLLVLLGLVGCKSSPLTVIFKDNECTFNGPTKFSDKKFNLVLVIDTKEHNGYGLGIYTLAEGKTVEDLKSLGFGATQPDWANLVLAFGLHPSGTYTYTIDPTKIRSTEESLCILFVSTEILRCRRQPLVIWGRWR